MSREHVSKQLSGYLDEEISAERKAQIAEHLLTCSRCRQEFDDLRVSAQLAQSLPVFSAPESIWAGITSGLDRPAVRRNQFHFLRPLAIAAALVLVVASGLWLLRSNRSTPGPYWTVSRLDGTPQIGSTRIDESGKLVVGQWLQTDGNSRARIDIANIGEAEIDPNTRLRLIETQPTEHRLELARGRISARVWAPPRLFFVNTPSGVAEDLGCAYTLEVDANGNSVLHVTTGWVSMQLTNRESAVPAGAACATRRGFGPGTPYFEDASDSFRSALSILDFGDNDSAKSTALKSVISEARPRDAMTLWYLLARVTAPERPLVYDRLAKLTPVPSGVTRDGIIGLNQQMLDLWKEDLGLAPNQKLSLKKKF